MNVDNLPDEVCDDPELSELLDQYSVDEIQIMIQQYAFDLKATRRIRPYLKSRILQKDKIK